MLKPLSKKCAEEVASTLVAIFYTLGAPNILQSDNGKEFDNTLLFETLHILWPSTKIIHGKPRKPQSQGSVENANCRVENILQSVLDREGHSHWAKELDRVAYLKNTTLHTVLNNSPRFFMEEIHLEDSVILIFQLHITLQSTPQNISVNCFQISKDYSITKTMHAIQ